MNIYLTFDYELFFGEKTGTIEKCILEPTDDLLNLCERYGIGMTFFVDVGFLIKLKEYSEKYELLSVQFQRIRFQFDRMKALGCSIQLHIHPHWENAIFDGFSWILKTDNCYKLADFSFEQADQIITNYHSFLSQLVDGPVHAFRAGGWCIQPFEHIRLALKKVGIKKDSSVFSGAKFESSDYFFDFTTAPQKGSYRFESDVCVEEQTGSFLEIPISSMRYQPFFYWMLYVNGRLFPSQHKMIGDGEFIPQPGRKFSHLTRSNWNHVSSDGYYAKKLKSARKILLQKGIHEMVVIGHPKGNTRYSLRKLEQFIQYAIRTSQFKVM